jgi:hypothetical protein
VERLAALRLYVLDWLLDGERKSIEPMGARLVVYARDIQEYSAVDFSSKSASRNARLQKRGVPIFWPTSEAQVHQAHRRVPRSTAVLQCSLMRRLRALPCLRVLPG